jgi:lysozyme family protein
MTLKQRTIDEIIDREGGYVDDPDDSGGRTMFGITRKVARANGYEGKMRDMPRSVAETIYSDRYWDSVRADQLCLLSEMVAAEVVDTAVNMGAGRAGRFLQRALNVLNKKQKLYNDIETDGAVGPATIAAVAAYLTHRDERTLTKALNCLQGSFYIELCESREKDERFVYGWLKNRVVI